VDIWFSFFHADVRLFLSACIGVKFGVHRRLKMENFIQSVSERVKTAAANKIPLAIHGGNSKSFYGAAIVGEALDMRGYAGIIDYQPRELVLTVRAGTKLFDIEAAMREANQMLPFEPPHFTQDATIGGTVAAGLSGPRRAYAGAVRDFVLGARVINGRGEDLRFGGRVIKNVAGYDVSRLMTGAMGTLGILTDLSFKVLPMPAAEITLQFSFDEATAIQRFNEWAGKPLPISASAWFDGVATLRLSGAVAGVAAAKAKLGGEEISSSEAKQFWQQLRDHQHDFFASSKPMWRLSVPATTKPIFTDTAQLIEWGGALRWLATEIDAEPLRATVASVGGHATLFRATTKNTTVFHPLPAKLAEIHRHLKNAFDPADILNRGRLDNF
jgi:glycolate oxidase FAD binding subunit